MSVSGRQLWSMSKIWMAVKDAPEVLGLFALVGVTLAQGVYITYREYGAAGECFPSVEVRHDPEKQLLYGPQTATKSIYYRIAEARHDDSGWKTGVFDNRAFPHEYDFPTKTMRRAAGAETDASTLVA